MTVSQSPLLWVLRDVLGLRGTKYGCGIGYCAACTVLIDGRNTKSCQTPAERAVGTAVITVGGTRRRRLDRDPQRHGHVQGTLDPLTPIRSGVLPRLHRFKDMGMGRGLR
jgi:aerobic-type carbon monoxide dehydrogenase small subunit (CoxS/CutS family)